ncbi:MAG TPA: putative quinol monooxygenase [Gemmatimonadaceae bacterium]
MNHAPEVADSSTDLDDDVSAIIASFGAALQDVGKPLAILAQFQVRDGTQDLVEAAFAEASVSTAEEPGVIAYQVHRERGAPTRFVVYERWRSLADLDAHLRTPYIRALRRVIDGAVVGTPEFRVLMPRAGSSRGA